MKNPDKYLPDPGDDREECVDCGAPTSSILHLKCDQCIEDDAAALDELEASADEDRAFARWGEP